MPYPQAVLAKSPNPSTDKIADLEKEDAKKADAIWLLWCSILYTFAFISFIFSENKFANSCFTELTLRKFLNLSNMTDNFNEVVNFINQG